MAKRKQRKARSSADKNVAFDVELSDLSKLKAIAMEKGIPYQTLLGSIVHQYVEGRLKETS